jgi:ribonuclease P protein component
VRREGKRVRTEHLEVRAVASLLHHGRVGVVVPRFKHTAVARNRLKRRLRELARTRLLPALPPLDIVIRPRPEAYGATFDALARQVERVGRELQKSVGRAARGER